MSRKRNLVKTLNSAIRPFGLRMTEVAELERIWHFDGSPEILHSRVRPQASYSPWLLDEGFIASYSVAREYSLVDKYRMYELWMLVRQTEHVEGDVLEVGVWRGGSGLLLSHAVQHLAKRVYLADTFSGVVKAGSRDTRYTGGEHADASIEDVRALLRSRGSDNVELLVGVFPDETGTRVEGKLAFIHVDVDVYESAKHVVEFAAPRMPSGGIMVFDDYGFYGCEGVTRLVNEMSRDARFTTIHNLNGHAVMIRRDGHV